MNLLTHFFVPHTSNNQRPKMIQVDTLLVLTLLFFITGFFAPRIEKAQPSVLGTQIDISSQDLLLYTNQQRIANDLPPLSLNNELTQAAASNAAYMLDKDYWAHFAPDGTSPWYFIKQAGYNYTYAGQNLARGYTSAQDVVSAWMASPDHRANILSRNYTDVGFAEVEGPLTGEKDTILVVEMFGNTGQPVGVLNGQTPQIPVSVSKGTLGEMQTALVKTPLIDMRSLAQKIVFFILFVILSVLVVDIVIARSRRIARVVGHNVDHILFLSCILGFVLFALGGLVN